MGGLGVTIYFVSFVDGRLRIKKILGKAIEFVVRDWGECFLMLSLEEITNFTTANYSIYTQASFFNR